MTCRAPSSASTCAGTQTGAQLSYDNQGQLASWQNAPSSPTSTDSFLYDGEGHRVAQIATTSGTTTTTSYVGTLEEISVTSATTTTTAYYSSVAESVNGALSYTLADNLGSVSVAIATSGTVTASQLYGPYGSVRYSNGTLPGTRAYTGQHADAVTGLDYYGARYYDSLAGQFTSADTELTAKNDAIPTSSQLNRYAYVGGNPETLTDPTGHRPSPPTNFYFPDDYYDGYPNNGPWTDQHRYDKDAYALPAVSDQRLAGAKWNTFMAKLKLGLGWQLSNAEISDLSTAIDANVLANYFQLTVIMQPEVLNGQTNPDYLVGIPKISAVAPWGGTIMLNGTYIEQYAPLSNSPRSSTDLPYAMSQAAKKAVQKARDQAAIIVVDISFSPTLSKMTKAQMQTFADSILYPDPSAVHNALGPARVLIILNGKVEVDENKAYIPQFGPSPQPPYGTV